MPTMTLQSSAVDFRRQAVSGVAQLTDASFVHTCAVLLTDFRLVRVIYPSRVGSLEQMAMIVTFLGLLLACESCSSQLEGLEFDVIAPVEPSSQAGLTTEMREDPDAALGRKRTSKFIHQKKSLLVS